MMTKANRAMLALHFLFLTSEAHAHVSADHFSGFTSGFFHPFTGLDHLAALAMIGLLAAHYGSARRIAVIGGFMAAMASGALPGMATGPSLIAEAGIALSLILLGGMLFVAGRPTYDRFLIPAAAMLGICHGHAHGAEAAANASEAAYIAGMLCASGLAIGISMAVGLWLTTRRLLAAKRGL